VKKAHKTEKGGDGSIKESEKKKKNVGSFGVDFCLYLWLMWSMVHE
jgi:hypothetical protein